MTVPFVRHSTTAVRAVWGDGALAASAEELRRLGIRRAVAICARSIAARTDVMDSIRAHLGERLVATFTDVREHSPLPEVLAAARLLDDVDADAVIAIGGGSAIVTARAATIIHAEKRDVRDLATHRDDGGRMISPRLLESKLPNIVFATTPTTAYAKAGAAVRDPDSGERLALFDPKVRAQLVVFDPMLARTAPRSLVSSASLNVLSMAVDGMQSVADDPLAEAVLSQGLREVVEALPELKSDGGDDRQRVRLMLSALMVGQGSDFAGTGIAQALSHALGPVSNVANGVVEAMLLPHTARFNFDVTGALQPRIADVLRHASSESGGLEHVAAGFLGSLGLPRTLSEVGITRNDLAGAVQRAGDDWSLTRVPKKASQADLLEILEGAL